MTVIKKESDFIGSINSRAEQYGLHGGFMRYTNYPKQRYGYGEPQMTKHDYNAMRKAEKRADRVLAVLSAIIMIALTVALYFGLTMRGIV